MKNKANIQTLLELGVVAVQHISQQTRMGITQITAKDAISQLREIQINLIHMLIRRNR